jgi:hypothetical protein
MSWTMEKRAWSCMTKMLQQMERVSIRIEGGNDLYLLCGSAIRRYGIMME